MSQFQIDDDKLGCIAQKFKLDRDIIDVLYGKYVPFKNRMKHHYLAHVIRSMEDYVREIHSAPMFRITCTPSSDNPALKGAGFATYTKKLCFNILYDSALDEKQARVVIAHELGHLFVIASLEKDYEHNHEPISSIFGVFTILDKNDFYAKKTHLYQHRSWQEIIDDFCLLRNKQNNRLNTSQ